MTDTDATPDPVPVTLADLAKITAQSRAPVQTIEERFAAAQKTRPTTPAGLPRGFAWRPHDTGKRGLAAQRRLRQRDRLAAKHAGKDTPHD
jgi:hypothetical protein